MRIGVMGGTFDPIHLGHLVAAQEVLWRLSLERVIFVPAGDPPHKGGREISPAADRVRMVQLAIGSNPAFELSLVDVERGGKSYTVDTIEILRGRLGAEAQLYFIVGMDSLSELSTWRDPLKLLSLCRLVAVSRPPHRDVDPSTLEAELPGISSRVDLVRTPGIEIASSDLQRRVAVGQPIKYQVPEAVEDYIYSHGLYSRERPSP